MNLTDAIVALIEQLLPNQPKERIRRIVVKELAKRAKRVKTA